MASPFRSLLLASCIWSVGSGCATSRMPPEAPSSNASRQAVLRAAIDLESGAEGRSASVGSGASMAPVYGENSVIVTHPVAFEDLEAGMIVAFLSPTRGRVIHQLTRKTRRGWKSQGINNATEDPGFVTEENLIGLVYGVFQSSSD